MSVPTSGQLLHIVAKAWKHYWIYAFVSAQNLHKKNVSILFSGTDVQYESVKVSYTIPICHTLLLIDSSEGPTFKPVLLTLLPFLYDIHSIKFLPQTKLHHTSSTWPLAFQIILMEQEGTILHCCPHRQHNVEVEILWPSRGCCVITSTISHVLAKSAGKWSWTACDERHKVPIPCLLWQRNLDLNSIASPSLSRCTELNSWRVSQLL